MGVVIKKGGRKQAFSASKIRKGILMAAREAKISSLKAKVLIREVGEPVISLYGKKRTVKAADLRRSILGRLDRKAKKVSAAWRKYDRKKRNE